MHLADALVFTVMMTVRVGKNCDFFI